MKRFFETLGVGIVFGVIILAVVGAIITIGYGIGQLLNFCTPIGLLCLFCILSGILFSFMEEYQ